MTMNSRKIKFALSAGLLNDASGNALLAAQDLMASFKDEVGAFLGLSQLKREPLNENHIRERYALKYERCTVDLDLVSNSVTNSRQVQRFQLR